MPSDIRVFVRWKEQSVFAGEEVQCTITFKNVADSLDENGADGKARGWARKDSVSSMHSRRLSNNGSMSPAIQLPFSPSRSNNPERRHRSTASLSITPSSATFPRSPSWNDATTPRQRHHQRSVSIVSLGGSESTPDAAALRMPPPPRRSPGGHSRSASLQVLPRSPGSMNDIPRPGEQNNMERRMKHNAEDTTGFPMRQTAPSPRASSIPFDSTRSNLQVPIKPSRRAPGLRSPSISPTASERGLRRQQYKELEFKFPASAPASDNSSPGPDRGGSSFSGHSDPTLSSSVQSQTQGHQVLAQSIAVNRVISGASIDGSVRSSGEFYSMSNRSSDTLESEQPRYNSKRPQLNLQNRMHSRVNSVSRPTQPERLLMGYAQINASFVLDGSLVDQSPFEEVKRKGFMGGQGGGGVVGVEKRKSRGGFLGAFNLSSISESLGGLLNSQDMSSTKEMNGVISSRSVPLLSTPQSLLFVDMELKPGEERSFSYTYKLPRGLPASHKGKAIRITYNLTIGTQSTGENTMQKVRSISVPLRVFSGVNAEGEVLGHDLMHPYVVLRDTAKTAPLDDAASTKISPKIHQSEKDFTSDFMAYTQALLEKKFRRQSSAATLDDSMMFVRKGVGPMSSNSKDLISLAVLRSNQVMDSDRSPNRFEISRNGKYVGAVVLNRPLHRLGETIVASIDFSGAQIQTLSLRSMLETCEKVEPSIALRSIASINRATKKVYATQAENTLYAARAVFSPSIPASATPTLYTSGVSLCWQLRFEFSTGRTPAEAIDDDATASKVDLLEEIGSDDRGVSKAAVETIQCESFEVTIPLTVYGEIVKETEEDEVIGLPI